MEAVPAMKVRLHFNKRPAVDGLSSSILLTKIYGEIVIQTEKHICSME